MGSSSRLLKNSGCRLLKKIQRRDARKIDELRRTYSTSQRGDLSATKHMGLFQQPASRLVLVVLIALAALIAQKDQSIAQEKVRIAWSGVSPANSPIWVVQEKRLLKKHGLNGEVISISASPIALQALLAGEVDVIVTSVTTLALSRLAGADTVMILGMVPTFLDHVISHPSITTLEQIRGKTGGVNRLGSTSDLGLRLALRRKGIDPEKDVKIITAGDNPARLAAISRRIIQVQYHAGAFSPRS